MSKPAASQTSIASRVLLATPPSVPPAGLGRMKARSCAESRSIRVLSPRIEPPDRLDEGSTASTATRWPAAIHCRPSASMKVDLPTPGTPEMPIRKARPAEGSSALSSASARWRWSGRVDSSRVMALATARRSPRRTPSTRLWSGAGRFTGAA